MNYANLEKDYFRERNPCPDEHGKQNRRGYHSGVYEADRGGENGDPRGGIGTGITRPMLHNLAP